MGLKIISGGKLTTIQDFAGKRNAETDKRSCGAIDTDSIIIANRLVCNNDAEGALEITATGITAKFTSDAVIAMTGADMNWEINGKDLPRYKAVEVKKGDKITCGETKNGYRAYMSVAGGFEIPLVDGSYSTDTEKGIGGFEGRALAEGDILNFRLDRTQLLGKYKGWAEIPDFPDDEAEIRVLSNSISADEYTVKFIEGKIGIYLENNDGIIFSAEAFNVVQADMTLLAQSPNNTKIRFISVSEKEARFINFKHKMKLAWLDYRLMF